MTKRGLRKVGYGALLLFAVGWVASLVGWCLDALLRATNGDWTLIATGAGCAVGLSFLVALLLGVQFLYEKLPEDRS